MSSTTGTLEAAGAHLQAAQVELEACIAGAFQEFHVASRLARAVDDVVSALAHVGEAERMLDPEGVT